MINRQETREQKEKSFWETDVHHRPGADPIENIVNKFREIPIFFTKLRQYSCYFQSAGRILELGAGQGWASCLVKKVFPDKPVIATDIAAAAVASTRLWESMLDVTLDGTAACRSYETPFPDGSFDLLFTFQAAHHFGRHRATLKEIHRLLSPGGVALYLSEPGCRGFIHPLAFKRVNKKRPVVDEDVLVYRKIQKMGAEIGLDVEVRFDTHLEGRGPIETLYYYVLGKVRFLRDVLPCTVDLIIRKEL